MRKSPFLVAALLVASLAACREYDDKLVTIAGPFGADLGGTWTLQSINGVLPFTTGNTTGAPCNSAQPCTNSITGGNMEIDYDNEKGWRMRLFYRRVRPATGQEWLLDSLKRGVWYSTTNAANETSVSLQVDFPTTNLFLGSVTDNLTTITTSGLVGIGVVSEAQTWIWKKNP